MKRIFLTGMACLMLALSVDSLAGDGRMPEGWNLLYPNEKERSEIRLIEPKMSPASQAESILQAVVTGQWDEQVSQLAEGGSPEHQWLARGRDADTFRLFYYCAASKDDTFAAVVLGAYVDQEGALQRRALVLEFAKSVERWKPTAGALPPAVMKYLETVLGARASKLSLPDGMLRILLTGSPLSDMIQSDTVPGAGGPGIGDDRGLSRFEPRPPQDLASAAVAASRVSSRSKALDVRMLGEGAGKDAPPKLAEFLLTAEAPLAQWRNAVAFRELADRKVVDLSRVAAPGITTPTEAFLAERYGYFHGAMDVLAKLYPDSRQFFEQASREGKTAVFGGALKACRMVTVVGEGNFTLGDSRYAMVVGMEEGQEDGGTVHSRVVRTFKRAPTGWHITSDLTRSLASVGANMMFQKTKATSHEYNESLRQVLTKWKDDGTLWEALRVE